MADRAGPGRRARPGVVELPSRSGLYRLFSVLSAGKHTTGSARPRHSLAARPDGPFSQLQVSVPGEAMEIDSTPLDVLVRLDDGVEGRVGLTGVVDVATWTVTAAVLQPSTKAADASALLARTVTPEPMRPGWAKVLAMSASPLSFLKPRPAHHPDVSRRGPVSSGNTLAATLAHG